LHRTLSDNKVFDHFRNLRLAEKLFIQGLTVVVILIIIQAWLNGVQRSLMNYLPPIGLAILVVITYLVQPIILGATNIALINSLHKTKGWQVSIWLNGVFLLLTFTTINLILRTTFSLAFFPDVAIIDLVLSFPFGCIARFSNGGWTKPID